MKKLILSSIVFMVMILSVVMPSSVLADNGFSIGPAHLNVDVPQNGSATTYVYITSDVEGELVVGTENLSFRVEPKSIPITPTDVNRKVELVVYGNLSLDEGQHSGKLTFLLYTGNNVAYGVKVNTDVNQELEDIEPTWGLAEGLDLLEQHFVIVIAVAGIVTALTLGIIIGKRSKTRVK